MIDTLTCAPGLETVHLPSRHIQRGACETYHSDSDLLISRLYLNPRSSVRISPTIAKQQLIETQIDVAENVWNRRKSTRHYWVIRYFSRSNLMFISQNLNYYFQNSCRNLPAFYHWLYLSSHYHTYSQIISYPVMGFGRAKPGRGRLPDPSVASIGRSNMYVGSGSV